MQTVNVVESLTIMADADPVSGRSSGRYRDSVLASCQPRHPSNLLSHKTLAAVVHGAHLAEVRDG